MRPDCRCGAALIISADWQKLTKEEELEPNWERSLGSSRTVQTCPESPAGRVTLQTVQKLHVSFSSFISGPGFICSCHKKGTLLAFKLDANIRRNAPEEVLMCSDLQPCTFIPTQPAN